MPPPEAPPLITLLATLFLFLATWVYFSLSMPLSQKEISPEAKIEVARLKDEGNVLFVRKDYSGASARYTDAIALDKSNAVLYANRSACRFKLRSFLDAASGAEKAIDIDPTYAKAYARLATAQDALGEQWISTQSWQNALDALPKQSSASASNSSYAESVKHQRKEYTAGLLAAQKVQQELVQWEMNSSRGSGLGLGVSGFGEHRWPHSPSRNGTRNGHEFGDVSSDSSNSDLLPWDCAKGMMGELASVEQWDSSAWVIAHAHAEFEEGVKLMEGTTSCVGVVLFNNAVITLLSNAVLTDSRAFYITDPDWISKYNKQAMAEATVSRAWSTGGPDIIKQALQRLQARGEGWDTVRPALNTTIRCWIMHGFLEGTLRNNHQADVEYTKRAVEIIKWGRTQWVGARKQDRGAIFEESFLRGVQGRYLEALMNFINSLQGPTNTGLKAEMLEELLTESEEVLESVDRHAMPPMEGKGSYFALAYWDYVKGRALAMQGFYHAQKASEDVVHCGKALLLYIRAVQCFPTDDEKYLWYHLVAFKHKMQPQGASVNLQLLVANVVRSCLPRVERIWGQVDLIQHPEYGIEVQAENVFQVEQTLKELLDRGQVGMDSIVWTPFDGRE